MALAYAVACRGGCHNRAFDVAGSQLRMGKWERVSPEGKAKLVKDGEDLGAVYDSLVFCAFAAKAVTLEDVSNMLYAVTGIESSVDSLLKAGERICNLERMFNVREGISRKDDTLPLRLLEEPIVNGPSKGHVVQLKEMLDNYYSLRGWDQNGIPTKYKLAELGIFPAYIKN